jgi:2-keto-4-pentenoate hydratase
VPSNLLRTHLRTVTDTPTLQTIAHTMRNAQDKAQTLALPTSQHAVFSVAEAYAVAQYVQQERIASGARCVGRKIGFTNAKIWDRYNVHQPIWGPMYQHSVFKQPAQFSLQGLLAPKIEPEIVLHFHKAPAPSADAAAILDCIDWVAHGFEIVQCHFADWQFKAADAIADGGLHGALLLGEAVPVATLGPTLLEAMRTFRLDLFCDGTLIDSGTGANVLSSPLAAVAHLVQLLANQAQQGPHGVALQAGEMVTTGTVTAAFDVRVGQTWHTLVQGIGLPGLSVEFTA